MQYEKTGKVNHHSRKRIPKVNINSNPSKPGKSVGYEDIYDEDYNAIEGIYDIDEDSLFEFGDIDSDDDILITGDANPSCSEYAADNEDIYELEADIEDTEIYQEQEIITPTYRVSRLDNGENIYVTLEKYVNIGDIITIRCEEGNDVDAVVIGKCTVL